MSVTPSVLYDMKYEEEVVRPLSPHTSVKLGQAIDHTFKFNMHMFDSMLQSGKSYAISPVSLMSSLVSMIIASDSESRSRLTKSLFDLDELTEKEEYLMLCQTKYHLSVALDAKKQYFSTASYLLLSREFKVKDSFRIAFKEYTGMEVRNLQEGVSICDEVKTCVGEGFDDIDFSDIDENSKLLIVSHSSFVPLWKHAFEKSSEKFEFLNADSSTTNVHFLRAKGNFQMGFSDYFHCDVITIPLRWEHMSMTIFLPEKDKSFSSAFQTRNECICEELENEVNSLHLSANDAEVWIPEIKVHTKVSMKKLVSALLDFQGNCSHILEGVIGDEVAVDDLIQVCNFETKANYCTKTRIDMDSGLDIFKCNRPFIFAVIANINGKNIIIYQGSIQQLFIC